MAIKYLLWGCVLFGLSALVWWPVPPGWGADSEEEPRLPLAMEVFLKKPKAKRYELHVHLTNISHEPVVVDVHDLPWVPLNDAAWLSVVRLDARRSPVTQLFPRGETGSQEIRLVPGESIQDVIVLQSRMPTLLDEIEQFGIQLAWDCPPRSLKFVCKQGSPRTITIPRHDAGQPDVYRIDRKLCHQWEREIGLIRIPEGHHVLFLHTSEAVMRHLKEVQALLLRVDDYVGHCHPNWTNSWDVSFFSEKRLAGFLQDEGNERYFEDGLWQKANIGQYSSQFRTLYRFPWIKTQSKVVYLSVYQLRQHARAVR